MKIGWIGLGNMGAPMSRRLLNAGYAVTVYNRTKTKEAQFVQQGIASAPSPQELITVSDVVFLMVSDDAAVRELFNGAEGLFSRSVQGKIFINMSTVSPAVSKELYALSKEKGAEYIDAPVSGSVKPAEDGTLVIIVGGDKYVYEKVKPLLSVLGRVSVYVGPSGMGNTAKLAVNTFLGIVTQGLAEVTLFAQQQGIATEDVLTIITNSAMASPFVKMKSDALLQNNFHAAFALKHLAKDLRLARAEGLQTPLGESVYQSFQDAEKKNLAEEDIIAIIKYLAQQR
jgi:3-hydroxyisobutyrate dehydrogenase